jgi:hypothetical protein
VGVGERDPFAGKAIDVRGLQAPRAVRRDIAITQIVGIDEDNVRRILRGCVWTASTSRMVAVRTLDLVMLTSPPPFTPPERHMIEPWRQGGTDTAIV